MLSAPEMRTDLRRAYATQLASARTALKPGFILNVRRVRIVQALSPNPMQANFRTSRMARSGDLGDQESISFKQEAAMTKFRTCSSAAVFGGAEPGKFRRQRRGDFDPCWFFMALLEAACVLCLLAAASGVQAQTIAPSAPLTVAQRFDAALVEYERNHWPEAFAALSALADSGHREAARMALQMGQYGPALYGREFVASADQLARWKQRWGCGADAVGAGCRQAMAAP